MDWTLFRIASDIAGVIMFTCFFNRAVNDREPLLLLLNGAMLIMVCYFLVINVVELVEHFKINT